jgi:hypothetical protein
VVPEPVGLRPRLHGGAACAARIHDAAVTPHLPPAR